MTRTVIAEATEIMKTAFTASYSVTVFGFRTGECKAFENLIYERFGVYTLLRVLSSALLGIEKPIQKEYRRYLDHTQDKVFIQAQ